MYCNPTRVLKTWEKIDEKLEVINHALVFQHPFSKDQSPSRPLVLSLITPKFLENLETCKSEIKIDEQTVLGSRYLAQKLSNQNCV
jgi:hypothetical protein